MPRFAMRRDENEAEIFLALRVAGCDPMRGFDVDIFACHLDGYGVFLEVKSAKGKLRDKQVWLADRFKDRYHVVRTVNQALIACGRMT
jgi:hypothetical protein